CANVILEAAVSQVAVGEALELTSPSRRPQTVHHEADEAQLGDCLNAAMVGVEALRGEEAVRPRVDLFDDGVRAVGVEVRREPEWAADVGVAVARLDPERLGGFPPGGQ